MSRLEVQLTISSYPQFLIKLFPKKKKNHHHIHTLHSPTSAMNLRYNHHLPSLPTPTTHPQNHHHHQHLTLRLSLPQLHPASTRATPPAAENHLPAVTAIEQPGGKMVVELVGTFNRLTERMNVKSNSYGRILFKALKVSIPLLQALPLSPDGRSPLSKSLSIAFLLADLQMDAEVIAAGILRELWEARVISMHEVKERIGIGTAHLLHESLRVKKIPFRADPLDDDNAAAIRKFCLTYYDIRAVVLDLALKLDMMRNLSYLPRYQQQKISLEVMKIHAPLAHAVGTYFLSVELEDLSFRYLFPSSYVYVDTWLKTHKAKSNDLIDFCKGKLFDSLTQDSLLASLVDNISINGRYKNRYSTMKKLLRDGRNPEEVNDIMGLRVVLSPISGVNLTKVGEKACYRAREIVQSLWKEMPHRSKDYIAKPKANGYKSLHMAVDVSDSENRRPLMEIQIRTIEMDTLAAGGTASHSLYKSGLMDPEEAKRLKAIMVAAAELAALRLQDLPSSFHNHTEIRQSDGVFLLLDKNGDGRISIEELMEVMEELGAQPDDAKEMMQLLDSNSDGSLSSDEFDSFQKQVELMRNIGDTDEQYKIMLEEKLPMADESGLIQIYRKELGNGVAVG
ncbi:hypothetical protein RND81_12G076700 [Saponaria officinalis]|uniref:GTP diphosphokinase n=1 Tax=Saponaria officinalis TaxID=3572 RepID=A0AAW1H7T2_SAPOF